MKSTTRSFLLGVLSVFSFDWVRLFDSDKIDDEIVDKVDEIDVEAMFKEIYPFADEKEAIASDWKNVGNSIQKAIEKYEAKRVPQV